MFLFLYLNWCEINMRFLQWFLLLQQDILYYYIYNFILKNPSLKPFIKLKKYYDISSVNYIISIKYILPSAYILFNSFQNPTLYTMLRHQETLYKTFNITYHVKYIPYPRLSYRPYDGTMCPVKGLYHEMHSIVIACRGVYHGN